MISIVISSRSRLQLENVEKNIGETIGCIYEIIAIDNSKGERGICAVYNEGARIAKFSIVCFMHEDISFETTDWGLRVIEHLKNRQIGLIGVAGGDTKGWVPSSWSSSIFPSEVSLVQHFRNSMNEPERIVRTGYPENTEMAKRVACLDGVWMCTRKDVLAHFSFDEKNLKGFHGYDIDFSLQAGTRFDVCVVFDIMLHHFSEGSFNKDWVDAAILISDKWASYLPFSVRNLKREEFVNQHWTSMRVFLKKQMDLRIPRLRVFKNLLKYSRTRYFHLFHFLHFCKLLVTYKITQTDNS